MNVTLACTTEFMAAQARLPKHLQKKVRKFLDTFRTNPKSSGINFERIDQATNSGLRSVRIDKQYRAIVQQSKLGNTFLCLWVDNHDNAYAWARTHKCAVHPDTGIIQIYPIEHATISRRQPVGSGPEQGLFARLKDRQLRRLSVPEELIPLVRSFESRADLDDNDDKLPEDAYLALIMLADGEEPYEDIVRDLQASKRGGAADDFDEALKDSKNRRGFVIIDDDESLRAMLDAPLGEWRIYMHPMQQRLVDMHAHGPMRVLGGAGTGKTVVAMHRAKRLAEDVFNQPDDRILFLMYSTNLCADIMSNLKKMCTPEAFGRIKVTNIDALVANGLRQSNLGGRMVYDNKIKTRTWKDAMDAQDDEIGYSRTFIRDEFYSVILPNGLATEDEYLAVARRGREKPLRRKSRKRLWPVFEAYRDILASKGLWEREDAMRVLRGSMASEKAQYRSIIVDEAQDLSAEGMRLIRAMVAKEDNDLLIVGDAHQRIFGRPVVLSHCGIDIRGRSRRLRINYRTPEEVRACAVGALEGMAFQELDGSLASVKGYRSLISGAHPIVRGLDSFAAEIDFIMSHIRELNVGEELHRICITAPTNDMAGKYAGVLDYKGFDVFKVRTDRRDDLSSKGIRISTMHRVKGLEFDHMIVAGINDGILPHKGRLKGASNAAAKDLIMREARSLLYVACTRTRKTLCVTSHGKPSSLIETLDLPN